MKFSYLPNEPLVALIAGVLILDSAKALELRDCFLPHNNRNTRVDSWPLVPLILPTPCNLKLTSLLWPYVQRPSAVYFWFPTNSH